jgi:hypothetical protein
MTQVFYAKEILPKHIDEIRALEAHYKHCFCLQEDGNLSHGNRTFDNPPARLERDADLLNLAHPLRSPDLNPIEAMWNIMKARMAGRKWATVAEFKADIQAEWDRITIAEIRRRIREMPSRCKKVIEQPQVRIKSNKW